MPTYIALLRGINVSGHKKIKMAELRLQLAEIGLQNVQTYIQSGNLIFEYPRSRESVLEEMISKMILECYGFDVFVIVLSREYLVEVLQNAPYLNQPGINPDRLYYCFLSKKPIPSDVEAIDIQKYIPEEFVLNGKLIYGHSPIGLGNAKMSTNFFEKKLKVQGTARNLKTVKKLIELAHS